MDMEDFIGPTPFVHPVIMVLGNYICFNVPKKKEKKSLYVWHVYVILIYKDKIKVIELYQISSMFLYCITKTKINMSYLTIKSDTPFKKGKGAKHTLTAY